MSPPIQLLRGLRQGFPLFSPLYVIQREVTTVNINKNKNTKGIKIPNNNKEVKISQYAEDSNFLLTEQESIKFVINFFEKFNKATGSSINLEKTKVLPTNTDQTSYIQKHEKNITILEQYQYIEILGIFSSRFKRHNPSQLAKHFNKNGKSYTKSVNETAIIARKINVNKYTNFSQSNLFK